MTKFCDQFNEALQENWKLCPSCGRTVQQMGYGTAEPEVGARQNGGKETNVGDERHSGA